MGMRWIAGAMCVVVVVLAGCSGRGVEFEVEHKTAAAVNPLADKSPRLGPFEKVWQTEIDLADDTDGTDTYVRSAVQLIGGRIVATSKSGVQAYDARTGKPSWHYREPGREVDGIASTDGVLVAVSDPASDSEAVEKVRHLVGLEVSTGKLLWENSEQWYPPSDGVIRSGETGMAAGGIVVVRSRDDSDRIGVDVRTGDKRWTVHVADLAENCEPTEGTPGKGELVLVVLDCEEPAVASSPRRTVLAALDAENGKPRWIRSATSGSQVEFRNGVALFQGDRDAAPELIGPDGKRLGLPAGATDCMARPCQLFAAAGKAVLVFHDTRSKVPFATGVTTIDLGSGRTTQISFGGIREWVLAEGQLHTIDQLEPLSMLPLALTIRQVGGTVTQAPLPIGSRGPDARQRLLTVAGGRVFTLQRRDGGTATVASYAPKGPVREPIALGGVQPDEWPDPCALLDGVRTDPRTPKKTPSGRMAVGAAVIPWTTCEAMLPSSTPADVSVEWVGATEQIAADIVAGPTNPAYHRVDVPGADEAYRTSKRTFSTIMLRVGRVIVSVRVSEGDGAGNLAAKVAENLHRSGF